MQNLLLQMIEDYQKEMDKGRKTGTDLKGLVANMQQSRKTKGAREVSRLMRNHQMMHQRSFQRLRIAS